jgi:hypothetical protein
MAKRLAATHEPADQQAETHIDADGLSWTLTSVALAAALVLAISVACASDILAFITSTDSCNLARTLTGFSPPCPAAAFSSACVSATATLKSAINFSLLTSSDNFSCFSALLVGPRSRRIDGPP